MLNLLVRNAKLYLSAVFFTLAAAFLVPSLPSSAAEVRKGIDVSSWQGEINWGAVKDSGVEFAMIRCGNLAYGLDERFVSNIAGASAAGLRVGVYCYTYAMTPAEAMQEAAFVVALCQNAGISYPIAIDLEDSCHKELSPEEQAGIVNAFCTVVYNAGYTPMVYSNVNWFNTRLAPVPWDHWVAQYNDVLEYQGVYTIWQYSGQGSVPGIAGKVDLDYCIQDYEALIPESGFLSVGGNTFYFSNYRRQFGLKNIGEKLYYFDQLGTMIQGWLGEGGNRFYFDPADGCAAASGFRVIDGSTYYFLPNGLSMTGLAGIEGSLYFFDGEGRMVTGWQFIDGGYYFFGGDGRLVQDAIFEDAAGVPVQVDSAGLLVAPEGYTPN